MEKHGTDDTQALTVYAQALVQKYGEGSAELACQMYDATAEAAGVAVPPAEPAAPAGYLETAGMVQGTLRSPPLMQAGVSRLVKQAGADTTLKNAIRDGAEWAWIPHGDTCPFCITLASRGWQRASKKALKGGHAQHIHAHCNCEDAIRFDSSTTVAGYDPDKYLDQYEKAGGDINAMRRVHYAQHRDAINAQKRAAWAAKHPRKEIKDTRAVRKKTNEFDTGRPESDIIKAGIRLPDIQIGRSIGAKAKNYEIMDLATGERFPLAEGSRIQDVEVFAGKGSRTPYRKAYKYANLYGGKPEDWQHVKGHGLIATEDGDRPAEIHWSQCSGFGKHDFFIKKWED